MDESVIEERKKCCICPKRHKYEPTAATLKKIAAGAPIDRGYAWLIAALGFVMCIIVSGLLRCQGLMVKLTIEYFDCSTVKGSAPFLVAYLFTHLLSPISSNLADHITTRRTTAIGAALLVSVNFTLYWFHHYTVMFILFGLFAAGGFGFVYSPSVCLVGQYFEAKRAIANGITMAGSTLGPMVLVPLFNLFDETYGYAGMFMVVACASAQLFIIASLQLPLSWFMNKSMNQLDSLNSQCETTNHQVIMENEKNNLNNNENNNNNEWSQSMALLSSSSSSSNQQKVKENDRKWFLSSPILVTAKEESNKAAEEEDVENQEEQSKIHKKCQSAHLSTLDLAFGSYQQIHFNSNQTKTLSKPNISSSKENESNNHHVNNNNVRRRDYFHCFSLLRKFMQHSVLREPLFIAMIFGLNFGMISGSTFFMVLPLRVSDLGMAKTVSNSILFYTAFADLFGRLSIGFIADAKLFSLRSLCLMPYVFLIIIWLSFATWATTHATLLFCGACCLFFNGCVVALSGAVLANELGVERLSDSLGTFLCGHGILCYAQLTFASFLRDLTNNWISVFYFTGGTVLLGFVSMIVGFLTHSKPFA